MITFDDGYYNNYILCLSAAQTARNEGSCVHHRQPVRAFHRQRRGKTPTDRICGLTACAKCGMCLRCRIIRGTPAHTAANAAAVYAAEAGQKTRYRRCSREIPSRRRRSSGRRTARALKPAMPIRSVHAPKRRRNAAQKHGLIVRSGCEGSASAVTRNPDCLFELGRFSRPAGAEHRKLPAAR